MADLPDEIAKRGAGFFLSSIQDSRPHAAQLQFQVALANGQVELRAGVGRTSRSNCLARPSVTILWPSADPNEHSLIVDGEARLDGDEHVVVSVTSAILHRRAPDRA